MDSMRHTLRLHKVVYVKLPSDDLVLAKANRLCVCDHVSLARLRIASRIVTAAPALRFYFDELADVSSSWPSGFLRDVRRAEHIGPAAPQCHP